MTPEARTALLTGLAGVVARYAQDHVTGGLEAVRLLRAAGATWSDLLGPPLPNDSYASKLLAYGYEPNLADSGRAVLAVLANATAFELAEAALLAHSTSDSIGAARQLGALARRLMISPTTLEAPA